MRARYAAVAGAGIAVFVLFALVPAHLALADLQVLIAGLLVGIVLARRVFDHVPLLVLCVFALASLARIAARVTPLHYGFFLLPPGLVVLGTLLFDVAPRVLGAAPWRRRAFAAVAVGLLGGVCVGVLRISILYFTEPRVELATRRGRLLVPPGAPELFLEDWLQTYPRGTKALAVPDGLGLLYAADLRPVGGMLSYVPMDLTAEGAEARAIQAWTAEPPEVVVWVKRDDQEVFGYRGFGIDYGVAAARWLLARYVPASDPRGDYVILVRNPAAAALR